MKPVSVIIPIYNTLDYLSECVDSILNQTLQDLEIILVNDGSTDGSEKAAAEYAAKYSSIILINQDNAGLSAARNAGLRAAAGKYVYFIDSDDYLEKTALEKMYLISERKHLDILGFAAQTFYESNELKKEYCNFDSSYVRKGAYSGTFSGKELLAALQHNGDYIASACLQFLRREYLIQNGIWFYEGIIHEDNLFTFEALIKAERAYCLKEAFYCRRVRSHSIMTKEENAANLRGYFICLMKQIQIASKADCKGEQKNEILTILKNLSNHVKQLYSMIGQEEVERFLEECSGEEWYLFQSIFAKYIDEINYINARGNRGLLHKVKTGMKILRQDGIKGLLRLIRHKIILRLERFQIYWLIKDRGVRYIWYRIKLKFMPKKICVSIIMPVYNAEKYLETCLKSILNQNLKHIEVICVNDGSTDHSIDILKRYRSKDSRIKIVEQTNKGAGAARNKGISYARGEYLLFLDADDVFSPELCNTAYFQSSRTKAQICLFGAQRYDMQKKEKEKMGWVLRENEIPGSVFSAADVKDKIFQITTGCPWSKMFSREFVLKNHLTFQNLKNANDVFFVRTACAAADRITAVKGQVLVTYRYNEGQNIQSQKRKAPLEFYKAFRALKKELKKRNIYELVERSYVNMVLQESLFNLETAGSEEAQKIITEFLVKEGFSFFEFEKYDRDYFYDQKQYEKYLRLAEDKKGTYLG